MNLGRFGGGSKGRAGRTVSLAVLRVMTGFPREIPICSGLNGSKRAGESFGVLNVARSLKLYGRESK